MNQPFTLKLITAIQAILQCVMLTVWPILTVGTFGFSVYQLLRMVFSGEPPIMDPVGLIFLSVGGAFLTMLYVDFLDNMKKSIAAMARGD